MNEIVIFENNYRIWPNNKRIHILFNSGISCNLPPNTKHPETVVGTTNLEPQNGDA